MRVVTGLIVSSLLLASACTGTGAEEGGYDCRCSPLTHYSVDPNVRTPGGISVDTSGFEVDLDYLDRQTADLEACLGLSIDRGGFDVKVAPDWYTSACSGNQGFPCDIDPAVCIASGRVPTEECPCACAGTVQPSGHVVLAQNLLAYRHEMIHLVVGTADHADPAFDLCEHDAAPKLKEMMP